MKKRILSVLLTLVMLLGLAPTAALAAEGDITISAPTELESSRASENGPEAEYSLDGGTTWTPCDELADVFWQTLSCKTQKVRLKRDVTLGTASINFIYNNNVTFDGQGHTIHRGTNTAYMLDINGGGQLTLENVVIDGGAVWDDADDVSSRTNSGYSGKGNQHLIYISNSGAEVTLGNGAILQNNSLSQSKYGGAAVMIEEGSLVMENGAVIRNNSAVGNSSGWGGGAGAVQIDSGAAFTMNGGEIYGNYASILGGAICNEGTLEINGGKIYNNASVSNGGAVMNTGSVTMTDGEITENRSRLGGGVLENGSGFAMNGGKIHNNTSTQLGGGVYCINNKFSVSGNVQITNNRNGEAENNTYLPSGKTITVSAALTDGANIGITTADAPAEEAPVNITGTNTADHSKYFNSDNAAYEIVNDENNVVQLVLPAAVHTHAWAAAWETNATHHWHECTAEGCGITDYSACGEAGAAYGAHTWATSADTACNGCGYVREVKTYGISGTVTEEDEDGKEKPMSGATVKLTGGKQSTEKSSTTDENGEYSFTGVAPGNYNVAVTKGDQTWTISVEIIDGDVTVPVIKMDGERCSVVEVKGQDTPAVVVGGVDAIAEAQDVQDGDTVTIKLTVEAKTESAAEGASAIKQTASGKTLEYIDLTLTKQINDGEETDIGGSNIQLLTIVIPFTKGDKKNITVYRCHGNQVEALPTAANADGEYFTVGDAAITVYAKKFSTYAIGYEESGSTDPGSSGDSEKPGGSGSSGSYSPTVYPVNVPDSTPNGAVSVSPKNAGKGTTVTVTVTPDEGYKVSKVTVTDKDGKEIAITDKGGGRYTFTMPAGNVAVSVSFAKINGGCADCPKDDTCPISKFTDASATAWYHDGVHYCVEQGLMVGISDAAFAPGMDTSRAMIATVLWRLEGSPVVNHILPFDDVAAGAWYTEAIRWAAASGVIGGYGNGLFGPSDSITREQLAAMLYRYAGSPETRGTLDGFTDRDKAGTWATDALRWAVEQGILTGKGGGVLDPAGFATRAEAAAMLERFCGNKK